MTASFLVTGDIHLTDDPRDEYRWSIFPWLARKAAKHGAKFVFILGDLTDKKDKHSAHLVNRIVDEVARLDSAVRGGAYLMMGNHDYDQDPNCPFFKFLPHYIRRPTVADFDSFKAFFIPHVRKTEGHEWPKIPPGTQFVFMHQTFDGALVENGQRIPGLPTDLLDVPKGCQIISGDVHVPQRLHGITYAGAPHPIHFGDSFDPRVLLWDGKELRSLRRNTIRKMMIEVSKVEDLDVPDLQEGDQVKIHYRLRRRDFHEWSKIRESIIAWADRRKVLLQGCTLEERKKKEPIEDPSSPRKTSPSHSDLLREFCEAKGIDRRYVKVGEDLVDGRAAEQTKGV